MPKRRKRISEVGQSQRLRIIHTLKRTQGLSVGELSTQLELSYMGIKQHCVELERQGLVDTWRQAKAIGRPEMLYRLTSKAQKFFPVANNRFTIELLEAAKRLYGASASEKLLYGLFSVKAEEYQSKLKGDSIQTQAESFAEIRDSEGYLSEVSLDGGLAIVDYHSPILDVMEAFPLVRRLEKEMMEKIFGVPVIREERTASGLYECRFVFR